MAYRAVGEIRFDGMQFRTDIGRKALAAQRRRTRRVRMKYAVVTFGCRVNQADSLEIEGELRARGAVGVAPGGRRCGRSSTRVR